MPKGSLEPADDLTDIDPADFCRSRGVRVPPLARPWVTSFPISGRKLAAVDAGAGNVPKIFLQSPDASKRFWEFFTANIRNRNTRKAYFVAVAQFSDWCEARKLAAARGAADPRRRVHRVAHGNAREADGEATPRRDPDALRLAGNRPGDPARTPRTRSAGRSTA